jgi:hypothetical protein
MCVSAAGISVKSAFSVGLVEIFLSCLSDLQLIREATNEQMNRKKGILRTVKAIFE